MRTFLVVGCLVAWATASVGCSKQYIPNTEILDTPFHREVIALCERYRHGVEDRNVELLLSLASPRYFDNAGTTDPEDDIDRQRLAAVLTDRFAAIQRIRYEIKYRDIFQQDNRIYVQFTYTMSFEYTVDGETRWHNHTGDKRIEIERDGSDLRVVSGM